jgi:hypothetical protein
MGLFLNQIQSTMLFNLQIAKQPCYLHAECVCARSGRLPRYYPYPLLSSGVLPTWITIKRGSPFHISSAICQSLVHCVSQAHIQQITKRCQPCIRFVVVGSYTCRGVTVHVQGRICPSTNCIGRPLVKRSPYLLSTVLPYFLIVLSPLSP